MTSETHTPDSELDNLLNQHFPGKVVRKDLTKLVKEGANVPVYVLEYLLGSYCASNDETVIEEGLRTVKKILSRELRPARRSREGEIHDLQAGSLKVIDKVTVTLNEKRDVYEALLGNLGVKAELKFTSAIVKKFEKLLVGGIWCIATLEYFYRGGTEGVAIFAPRAEADPDAEYGSGGIVPGTPGLQRAAVD